MGFFTRLETRLRQVNSLLCVGLDPHPVYLPEPSAKAARDFCLRLMDATADLAAAFKPNSAFFEAYGAAGVAALAQVIAASPPEVPVILDAKRGDIASTAQAYATAAFQALGADAVTLSPYLGYDSIQPFLEDPQRGVFLLCKTSNPGAADLQDLRLAGTAGGLTVYETVARLGQAWNQKDNLGLVVGATHPEALRRVRSLAPGLWLLAPGVGAQGGDLRQALQAGLRSDGLGLLLPVSRGISQAARPRQAALELREAINEQRNLIGEQLSAGLDRSPAVCHQSPIQTSDLTTLADQLLEVGCVKFGQFTLKSGFQSPIYLDLRQLVSYPSLLEQVARAYLPILRRLAFDRLAALPYAALPIATAISLQSGWPIIYPRKEAKSYGTRLEIEGSYQPGERVVVVDDLATTGGSKFEAIQKLLAASLRVTDVVVLIDRQSGAAQALERAGYHLHAVFGLTQLLDHWELTGRVPKAQIQAVREFLDHASIE